MGYSKSAQNWVWRSTEKLEEGEEWNKQFTKRGNIADILRQEGEHVSYHSRVMGNALYFSSIASLFQAKDAYDITLPDIIYVLLFLENLYYED